MSSEKLFQALDGISDEKLESAMYVYERKRKRRAVWFRAAVCAAMVVLLIGAVFFWPAAEGNYITSPGMITVLACEADETEDGTVKSVVLEEGVEFTPEYIYRTDTSYREDYPFFFRFAYDMYSSEDLTLEVSTNSGIFYRHTPGDLTMVGKPPIEQLLYDYYGQNFMVGADEALYWQPDGFDYAYLKEQYAKGNTVLSKVLREFGFNDNASFFDIIIHAKGKIVGYCVMEVRRYPTEISPYAHRFTFEVVEIVGFPMVDGKYQSVSYKYVQEQIQKIHLERESLS